MKYSSAFLVLAAVLAVSSAAMADSFTFSYSDSSGASGSGTLVGTDLGYDALYASEEYLITSATGTFDDGTNSGAISLIPNPNSDDSEAESPSSIFYDDLLFPAGTAGVFVDFDGLLFNFNGGELNLYSSTPDISGDTTYWYEDSGANNGPGTFAVEDVGAPVPEPGTLPLLCTGLLGLFVVLMREAERVMNLCPIHRAPFAR